MKKRMRKYLMMFYIGLVSLLAFVGCSKDENVDDNSGSGKGFAPTSIVGKKLTLYNASMQASLYASSINSSSGCQILDGSSQGTYSFIKGKGNEATFKVDYAWRIQMPHADYTNANITYDVVLTFTSKAGGTYKGMLKEIDVSNIASFNKNTTKSISGTFELE